MADDVQSNIGINIDTDAALASIKNLQRQISAFQQTLSKGSADQVYLGRQLQQNLINNINATGQFAASMARINTSAESFTTALEKNKLSMGEYFRYAGGASKSFGKLFKSEFDTIGKVARERVKDLQTQYIKLGRDASGAMQAIKVRPLSLDMQNLATKTAIAAQKQQLLNQLLHQGSTNLLNFGKNTQWAGRQLMVGFTIPLSMLGTAAAKTFMDMEKQAIAFKRVYGDMFTTTEQTNKALGDIKKLAEEFTKYGVAVADTMELAAQAAAAGKMGADLTAQVAQATKLAVLGNVEQSQALETTISLTNAFGISAENLSGKIDFLNAVENQTVTSIEDLTIAIPKAGPVIEQLGGSVEDLAFFLTAMKEGGINASEGANALKSGLAAMINPTGKAAEMLGGLGINLKGIVEANKGDVKNTVIGFAQALDTLDPLNRARAIEQLFGKFQFARISTLFKNVIAEGSQATRVLGLTAATAEELAILSEREMAKISDSPMYKFQKSVEDLKAKLAPLGEAFLKAVTPIVEFGSKLLDKFNSLDEGAKNFIIGITAVLGGIGPIAVMTFGLLANGVAQIIKGFVAVKSIFNKTGSSSTVLGQEVSYMTSEQIRAASVAASLEQVHGKLIQVFTSEAGAVDNLANAYKRAVSAQAGFMGGAGSKGKKPKGYASGIVSVPGPKGAGDVVPAMLSPGEAVIPAALAKKYGGLIQGMVADNIPGYTKGRPGDTSVSGYGNATIFMPEGMNKALDNASVPTKEVTDYLKKAGRAAMAPLMFAMAKEMGLKVTDPKFKAEWAKVGDQLSTTVITALDKSGKQMVRDEDLEEILIPALKKTTAKINIAGKNLGEAFEKTAYNIYTANRTGSSSKNKAGVDTGAGGRQPISRMAYASLRAKSQDYAIEENSSMFRREVVPSKSRGTKRQFQTMGAAGWDQGVMAHLTKSVTMTMDQLLAKVKPYLGDVTTRVTKVIFRDVKASAGQAAAETVKAGGEGYVDGAKKAAKTNSPSRRTAKVAKDTVDGYVIGLEQGKKRVAATGASTGAYRDPSTGRFAKAPAATLRSKAATGVRNFVGGMGPGSVGMAASGLMMGAAMMPGPIGETASALQGPIFAASSALALVPGPAKLVVAALAGIGVAGFLVKQKFDDTRNAAIKLAEATGNGTKAMDELAKASGKASAGQVMDRRRANAMSVIPVAAGKSEFGESFIKTEAGKSMLSGVQNAGSNAQSQLFGQLSGAVSSGSLGVEQARSIAASIGAELGNYELALDVNGKLTELFGVNGENLLTDGLAIRVKLIQENTSAIKASGEKLQGFNPTTDAGVTAGITAVGAGVGALVGGIAGGGVGAVPGAVAGAYLGNMASSTIQTLGNLNQINQESAAFATNAKMALQYNQDQIDALELDYEKRIAIAQQSDDQAEVERLINERIQARQDLLVENKATVDTILSSFKNADWIKQGFMGQAVDAQIAERYKGTGKEALAQSSLNSINSAEGTLEQKYVLKTYLASGDLSTTQIDTLLGMVKSKGITTEAGVNFLAKYGAGFTSQTLDLVNLFDTEKQKTDFMISLSKKDPTDAQKTLDAFTEIQKLGGVIDVDVLLNYYEKNPEQALAVKQAIDTLKDMKGPLTLDIVASVLGADKIKEMNIDAAMFNALPKSSQLNYIAAVTGVMNLQGNPAMMQQWENWARANAGKDVSFPAFANYLAGKQVAATQSTPKPASPSSTTGGGGEKAVDLLKEVNKNIRDAKLTKALSAKNIAPGLVEMLASASRKTQDLYITFKNNKWVLTKQGQLLQQAYNTKILKEFSAAITTQQEAAKDQLTTRVALVKAGFKYTEAVKLATRADIQAAYAAALATKGTVARKKALEAFYKLVRAGQAAEESLRTPADVMEEYLEKNRQISTEYYNQYVGVKKLVGMGYSLADAYAMLEDAEVAAAVAGGKISDEKLKEVLAAAKLAKDAMEQLAATKAITTKNEEFSNQTEVVKRLSVSKYSDAQRQAIMDDVDLQKMYLANPFSDAFITALENAVNKGKYQIDVNNLTVEGMEKNFQDAFDMAMERVSSQETKINLAFETKTKGDKAIADLAEQNIADYNYQIDDLEASLKPIEDAENKINEKYDKRIKALDAVAAANEKIARQQQQQLGIADAITRGDIAGAASAMQEARAAEAAASIADQKTALEKNKELSLASLVNAQGLTRTEVEAKIKDLKDKIFNIEEASLEPANRRIELAERERDLALEIWGIEKERLEKAKNLVDIAKTDQQSYKDALGIAEGYALSLVDKYKNGGNVVSSTIDPRQGDGNATRGPEPTLPQTPPPTEPPPVVDPTTGVTKGPTKAPGGSSGNNGGNPTAAPTTAPVTPRPFGVAPTPYKTKRYIGSTLEDVMVTDAYYSGSQFIPEKVVIIKKTTPAPTIPKPYLTKRYIGGTMEDVMVTDAYYSGSTFIPEKVVIVKKTTAKPTTKAPVKTTLKAPAKPGKINPGLLASGGMVPKYFAVGGFARGTDTVPAMLTPGEFVVKKFAVDSFGAENLKAINNGTFSGGSVYNYDVNINVRSEANVNDIARTVITEIKRIDSQRIRGNKFNG